MNGRDRGKVCNKEEVVEELEWGGLLGFDNLLYHFTAGIFHLLRSGDAILIGTGNLFVLVLMVVEMCERVRNPRYDLGSSLSEPLAAKVPSISLPLACFIGQG